MWQLCHWDSVSCLDTAFMEVPLCAAVCGTIAGVYLIAVPQEDMYHSSRNPNLLEGVIHSNWLTSIQWFKCFAAFVSLCLSRFKRASICSWTCGADGSLLWILARMVVLSQHWYNSSAGDGSLLSMGITQSASKARCGLAPLYLARWSACLTDLMHASANPLDCG